MKQTHYATTATMLSLGTLWMVGIVSPVMALSLAWLGNLGAGGGWAPYCLSDG